MESGRRGGRKDDDVKSPSLFLSKRVFLASAAFQISGNFPTKEK